jgi:hypothetical protein
LLNEDAIPCNWLLEGCHFSDNMKEQPSTGSDSGLNIRFHFFLIERIKQFVIQIGYELVKLVGYSEIG